MRFVKCLGFLLCIIFSSCDKHDDDTYMYKDAVTQSRSAKRGVAFNYQFLTDVSVLGKGISWSYNWGLSQNATFDDIIKESNVEFCPMAWNGVNESELRAYVNTHSECKYLLAFNEPNLTDQANMTPQQAAAKWGEVKSIANELGLKIISPAMNYGTLEAYSDPIVWLDEFFSLVPIDDVEGIAVHCYMPSAGAVKLYLERFKKYNKPIWLTEFCAWDGLNEGSYTPLGQQQYMSDVINYLEGSSIVYRYAWFIPRGNGSEDNFPYMFLLKNSINSELTELGNIYMQMSSQDKSIYYVENQQIEAEHYSSICIASANPGEWVNGPKLRTTSDSPNESLELYQFLTNQWVEYQILADRDKEYSLELRYASIVDAEIAIEIDGQLQNTANLPKTSEEYIWFTGNVPLKISKGKHTIRVNLNKGKICLNWLKFK